MTETPPLDGSAGDTLSKLRMAHRYGSGVVVELSADLALDGRYWRHPVRFLRLRHDLTAADLAAEWPAGRAAADLS